VTGAVPEPLPVWLTSARRTCVLTGAAISTDSGIPDHRGPNGAWTRDPQAETLVTLSCSLADPGIRRRSWLMRRELQAADHQPDARQAALVGRQRQGRIRGGAQGSCNRSGLPGVRRNPEVGDDPPR
jgi:NAD-dependent deacetylase